MKSPTLRGLVSCRSRPWSCPSRAFPSRGAAPALAGRCFLAGSLSDCRRRSARRIFTTAFPLRASSLPHASTRRRTPRRMSQDDGSSRSLVRSPRRTVRCAARPVLFPPALGSPVNGRHARFEALLPPGVRSATTLTLARQGPSVGALLGFSPSRALSTTVLDPVCRVDTRGGQKPLTTCISGRPAVAVADRDPDSDA